MRKEKKQQPRAKNSSNNDHNNIGEIQAMTTSTSNLQKEIGNAAGANEACTNRRSRE